MTMVEGVILQEIVLRSRSDPPFLWKLCFPRGRKRHFNGSYGLHLTYNCPSLMCIGCTTTYIAYVENEEILVDLHTGQHARALTT